MKQDDKQISVYIDSIKITDLNRVRTVQVWFNGEEARVLAQGSGRSEYYVITGLNNKNSDRNGKETI